MNVDAAVLTGDDTHAEAGEPATSSIAVATVKAAGEHETLKYHLLGPSLTKSGQDTVDQQKVCLRIYLY